MDDLSRKAAGLRPIVDVDWSDQDLAGLERGYRTRYRRSQQRRAALGAAGALVLVAGGAIGLARWQGTAEVAGPGSIALDDGSAVTPLAPETRIDPVEDSPARTVIKLRQGRARFEVRPRGSRPFRVEANGVVVEVIGTRFTVDRAERATRVSVEHGHVRVTAYGRTVDLHAGQRESFAPPEPKALPEQPVVEAPAPAVEPVKRPAAPAPRALPARVSALLQAEKPREAFAAIGPGELPRVLATAGPRELFAIAEGARLNRKPHDAASALEALQRRFPRDGAAGLAAFELGRLRLEVFRDPGAAARAFEDALTLSPAAPFREDLGARHVEALDAAGDRGRCLEARKAYLARYPGGPHAATVARRCGSP